MPHADRIVAFHIDMNFVCPPVDYLRGWLERIATMGYNAILWELENKVQWETCRECVWPEAMSKADFGDLLSRSRELGLEPIPLLQTIGHGEYVLQHDRYAGFRELADHHDCYCTSNPQVRAFLKQWIEEYLDLFGELNHFHLGGDEAYVFGTCPRCAARVREVGRNGLYAEHLTDLAQPLRSRSVRPAIWGDMIVENPADIAAIPSDFVIWDWNYGDGCQPPAQSYVKGVGNLTRQQVDADLKARIPELTDENGELRPFYTAAMLQRLGFDVVLCSATRSAGDSVFAGRHAVHAQNVIGAAQTAADLGMLGTCVTSWAIRLSNYEIQHPWMLLGPMAFNQPTQSAPELLSQAAQELFGIAGDAFFDAIDQVGSAFLLARSVGATAQAIQWNGWKDSKPVPAGYLADKLKTWTAPEHRESWAEEQTRLDEAVKRIAEGHARLLDLLRDVNSGLSIIREWLMAAYHQAAHARVAQDIMARTAGRPAVAPEQMVEYLRGSKKDFIQWAVKWMTPKSAEKNAGLVFDCVVEYYAALADRPLPAADVPGAID